MVFGRKEKTLDWFFLLPILFVLGAGVSVFVALALFTSQRLVNPRLDAPAAVDDKAQRLAVSLAYQSDLRALDSWLQTAIADNEAMMKKVGAVFFSTHVPAEARDRHFQAVVALRKSQADGINVAKEDLRQQLLRLVRRLETQK